MAAQKGRDFLLKMGDGASSEAFTTVAGLRNVSFSVNNSIVDVTTKSNAPNRTLLEQAGIRSVSISADGLFEDTAFEETLRAASFDDTINNFQIILPNEDTLEGAFEVSSYQRSGSHDGAETFSLTLESSGAPTYTAV